MLFIMPTLENFSWKLRENAFELYTHLDFGSQSQYYVHYYILKILANGSSQLNEAQRRILASAIKSAYISGVSLEGKDKTRYNDIIQELVKLSTKFR